MNRFFASAAALAISAAVALPGLAAEKTTTFNVSIEIGNDCTISANDLVFGSGAVGVLDTSIDSTTTMDVLCTAGLDYAVGISDGASPQSSPTRRQMTGGPSSETISYELYTNASRSNVWGAIATSAGGSSTAVSGTSLVTGIGSGDTQTLTVYGRVPTQTTPQAGTYNDNVTVTISF
ncbi:spore coat U domain-containing protein [Zavarzinia compransoris]|uniref:Csu type fimbrial protein n=1 Tax=Zavarzinia marina TaxID=2911065 RepID=UPI001F1F081E|nr:spore coat U domain-containing protein [Zavarzinia marina]MCF4164227.1 spore coat U domain-containing protein [Zavarzinia marina]